MTGSRKYVELLPEEGDWFRNTRDATQRERVIRGLVVEDGRDGEPTAERALAFCALLLDERGRHYPDSKPMCDGYLALLQRALTPNTEETA